MTMAASSAASPVHHQQQQHPRRHGTEDTSENHVIVGNADRHQGKQSATTTTAVKPKQQPQPQQQQEQGRVNGVGIPQPTRASSRRKPAQRRPSHRHPNMQSTKSSRLPSASVTSITATVAGEGAVTVTAPNNDTTSANGLGAASASRTTATVLSTEAAVDRTNASLPAFSPLKRRKKAGPKKTNQQQQQQQQQQPHDASGETNGSRQFIIASNASGTSITTTNTAASSSTTAAATAAAATAASTAVASNPSSTRKRPTPTQGSLKPPLQSCQQVPLPPSPRLSPARLAMTANRTNNQPLRAQPTGPSLTGSTGTSFFCSADGLDLPITRTPFQTMRLMNTAWYAVFCMSDGGGLAEATRLDAATKNHLGGREPTFLPKGRYYMNMDVATYKKYVYMQALYYGRGMEFDGDENVIKGGSSSSNTTKTTDPPQPAPLSPASQFSKSAFVKLKCKHNGCPFSIGTQQRTEGDLVCQIVLRFENHTCKTDDHLFQGDDSAFANRDSSNDSLVSLDFLVLFLKSHFIFKQRQNAKPITDAHVFADLPGAEGLRETLIDDYQLLITVETLQKALVPLQMEYAAYVQRQQQQQQQLQQLQEQQTAQQRGRQISSPRRNSHSTVNTPATPSTKSVCTRQSSRLLLKSGRAGIDALSTKEHIADSSMSDIDFDDDDDKHSHDVAVSSNNMTPAKTNHDRLEDDKTPIVSHKSGSHGEVDSSGKNSSRKILSSKNKESSSKLDVDADEDDESSEQRTITPEPDGPDTGSKAKTTTPTASTKSTVHVAKTSTQSPKKKAAAISKKALPVKSKKVGGSVANGDDKTNMLSEKKRQGAISVEVNEGADTFHEMEFDGSSIILVRKLRVVVAEGLVFESTKDNIYDPFFRGEVMEYSPWIYNPDEAERLERFEKDLEMGSIPSHMIIPNRPSLIGLLHYYQGLVNKGLCMDVRFPNIQSKSFVPDRKVIKDLIRRKLRILKVQLKKHHAVILTVDTNTRNRKRKWDDDLPETVLLKRHRRNEESEMAESRMEKEKAKDLWLETRHRRPVTREEKEQQKKQAELNDKINTFIEAPVLFERDTSRRFTVSRRGSNAIKDSCGEEDCLLCRTNSSCSSAAKTALLMPPYRKFMCPFFASTQEDDQGDGAPSQNEGVSLRYSRTMHERTYFVLSQMKHTIKFIKSFNKSIDPASPEFIEQYGDPDPDSEEYSSAEDD